MVDVFSKTKRSEIMSRIRGKGNAATELVVLRLLRRNRISGWRRHYCVPGRPDFAFPSLRVAIFVDGCFWHGCPHCKKTVKSRKRYWTAKIEANRRRDAKVDRALRRDGWAVVRIWQCRLKDEATVVRRIVGKLVERGYAPRNSRD